MRRMAKLGLLLGLPVALAACAGRPAPERAATSAVAHERVESGGYTLELPAGLQASAAYVP